MESNSQTSKHIEQLIHSSGFNLTEIFSPESLNLGFASYFAKIHPDPPIQLDLSFFPSAHCFGFHYMLLGCPLKIKQIVLHANQKFTLDLSAEIRNGKLLYVNYTPHGPLYPLEIHGNCPMGHEYILRKTLYPLPAYDSISPDTETTVSILYIYATEEQLQDFALHQLIESFEHFFLREYPLMILKSHMACEISLTHFLTTTMSNSSKHSYATRLKKDLPQLAQEKKIPLPADFIMQRIDTLRDLRNKIIHEGQTLSISQNDAALYLKASLLFLQILKPFPINWYILTPPYGKCIISQLSLLWYL